MKCSELLRLLKRNGWYEVSRKGSHVKMRHSHKPNVVIVPDHGSAEMGKGLEVKILKSCGIKK